MGQEKNNFEVGEIIEIQFLDRTTDGNWRNDSKYIAVVTKAHYLVNWIKAEMIERFIDGKWEWKNKGDIYVDRRDIDNETIVVISHGVQRKQDVNTID